MALKNREIIKSLLLVALTVIMILANEWGRMTGRQIPIPFLLIFTSVVISGGEAGKLAGALSGIIAALYVIYASAIGYGPVALTGGPLQAILGVLLYAGTGIVLGRVRDQRNQYLEKLQRHEAELESEVESRTQKLRENEAALRASEEMFRQLAENIPEVFCMIDLQSNKLIYISPAYETVWGRSCQSLFDDPDYFEYTVHPDDRERMKSVFNRRPGQYYDEEYRIIQPEGAVRIIRERGFPVADEKGEFYRMAVLSEDITESAFREEQLRHAQKMEVIGQLTGGVAHDFNNLLTVIMGNLEIIDNMEDSSKIAPYLRGAIDASEKGADLTARLLSFSRNKPMAPEVVEVGAIVCGLESIMQMSLGESIYLEIMDKSEKWHSRVDIGQLENALLNLAVNARDAMPEGGRFTVEVRNISLNGWNDTIVPNAKAGEYISIRVIDTGCGIPRELINDVFIPFFTTKEEGQGTGLGLSMVYGFVKQSEGYIHVDSDVNQGTAVTIYLPRWKEPAGLEADASTQE